jgi:D-glycero-alpha-D-manno-heptose-7-phosphate kinase
MFDKPFDSGRPMLIRSKAPLRVSFAGGGTDVPPFPETEGGCVLSATINKYAFGALRPRDNGQIRIESLDFGLTIECDTQTELTYDGKLDMAKAAIRNLGGQSPTGFDLFLHTDAPPGSGLGSSSSLMVAMVGLLRDFKGLSLTNYEIAELAYALERNELGIKGGFQDQYAASFGGFNFIEFLDKQVVVNPLRISQDTINELEHNLLLCFTGTTRVSDSIISDQTRRYERSEIDTVSGLRSQKQLAVEMKKSLLHGRLDDFGDLLNSAWEFKKKMSPKISNPMIDQLYSEAKMAGALGGKIMGAGGGGFMLFYCPFEQKHKIATRLKQIGASLSEFAFEEHGLQTWRVESSHLAMAAKDSGL